MRPKILWACLVPTKFNLAVLKGLGFWRRFVLCLENDSEISITVSIYRAICAQMSLIFYKRDRLRAAVSIKNLFDINYYESAFW